MRIICALWLSISLIYWPMVLSGRRAIPTAYDPTAREDWRIIARFLLITDLLALAVFIV